MFTMPLLEPIAAHRSPPRRLRSLSPPSAITVVPTAPSSIQRPTTLRSFMSYSLTSPFFPTTANPSPSPHHAKSAMPPRLSIRHEQTYCIVSVERTLMQPPPLRPEPIKPMYWPHGESLNRSIVRWEERKFGFEDVRGRETLDMLPVARDQVWK